MASSYLPHSRANRIYPILLVAIIALSAALVWRLLKDRPKGLHRDAEPRAIVARGALAEDEQNNIAIFKEAAPSVVHITNLDLRRSYYTLNVEAIPKGTGSGFVWDENGYVVTNFHVLQGGKAWEVTLADGTPCQARFVGAEPVKDLAVLHIDAPKEKLRPIMLGTSADLQVGQKVLAIGNPFGLDYTLTTGVISGLGREISSPAGLPIRGVVQTDAAINPGNSGGPLLDSAGRLIGVNTAIKSPSGASAGLGFAVPVDVVNRVVPQLIQRGTADRASLGVTFMDDRFARRYRFRGVVVDHVPAEGSAASAGLRGTRRDGYQVDAVGDQIIAIDGELVSDETDLWKVLFNREIGQKVRLTVLRSRRQVELEVPLVTER